MAPPNTNPPGNGGNGSNGHGGGHHHTADAPANGSEWTSLFRAVSMDARRPRLQALMMKDSDDPSVLVTPDGYKVESIRKYLDEYRTRPQLRAGTTELRDLASFNSWINFHKDWNSVVYAFDDMAHASLTAIIDHDESGPEIDALMRVADVKASDSTGDDVTLGEPALLRAEDRLARARFMRHRGVYKFPLSREWQEWNKVSRQPMKTGDFAGFVERRVGDVVPPPLKMDGQSLDIQDPEIIKLAVELGKKFATPADLVKLAQGIEINVDATAKVSINRDTGEHFVEYSEANGQGAERIKPPNAFLIAIPVVNNGQPVLMGVHLRYRAVGGQVVWTIELHQPERVFETVFQSALEEVFSDTGLTPLRGIAPEKR